MVTIEKSNLRIKVLIRSEHHYGRWFMQSAGFTNLFATPLIGIIEQASHPSIQYRFQFEGRISFLTALHKSIICVYQAILPQ